MASALNDAPGEPTVPKERQSERFSSTDGEIIIFHSSDSVLFNIHRTNLRAVTDGPFAEDFASGKTDIADLTEDSETLEILFQYVYPGHLPSLEGVEFKRLYAIAEAAEKYHVSPAMVVCNIRMKLLYPSYPLEVIAYAYKHGYIDLPDIVGPSSMGKPASEAFEAMGAGVLYAGWSMYKDAYAQVVSIGTYDLRIRHDHDCMRWRYIVYDVERLLGENRFRHLTNASILTSCASQYANICQSYGTGGQTFCRIYAQNLATALESQTKAIPPLSTFVTRATKSV
ncbi:hypothetical protein FB107DRAFT_223852 [Schizophyllum commune]